MSFLEWLPNCWADHAEILHSLWGIPCAASGEKIPGQVRSPSYDVIRGIASHRLFKEIVVSYGRIIMTLVVVAPLNPDKQANNKGNRVFSHGLAAIDWIGDIMHG